MTSTEPITSPSALPEAREPRTERRGAPRIPSRLYFSAGRIEGVGTIRDFSPCGAQVAASGLQPTPGGTVKLLFPTGTAEAPLEVVATVTRRTRSGFAVRFRDLDPRLHGHLLAAHQTEAPRNEASEVVWRPAASAEEMVVFPGYLCETDVA